MTPQRWQQIKQVFDAALAHPASERAGFLDATCRADDSLRHEVDILLASHTDAENFLETPAAGEVARLIVAQNGFAAGQHIGRYEIISALGAGGMGEVYRAHDTKLGREVAVKVLPRLSTADSDLLLRFEQEAFTASALNHPNILTVYEFGEVDSQPFIATEYVDGVTLRQYMKRSQVTVREALEIASQLASALAAAHKAGVIHRDVKPENIMIRHDDGLVKVLDFGLAKLSEPPAVAGGFNVGTEAATRARINTSPGVVMGTANYMSPEQARGLPVDERTDIWSLGVVLYEMVAGRLPFDGQTTSDVVSMILQKEPPALTRLSTEANERLDEIAAKTLAKDREERYQVAKDLLIDLRRLKQHLDFATEIDRTSVPELGRNGDANRASGRGIKQSIAETEVVSAAVPTRVSSAEYIITEIKRHRKGVVLVATGVLAFLVLAAVSYWWLSHRRPPALTDKDTVLLADFANNTGDVVFDGTLKQALAAQLSQSPFLNIFSDDHVRDALRFMGRSPDERVTRDIAREICQRQGLKALLAGSISGLGTHYVITLEAIAAQTGDSIVREQVEAESKEQVVKTLGEAATKLREKLGESLASIQKFDAPVEQATTSSLEALKAYSLGRELALKGKSADAVPLLKRATELDPNFAVAYNSLALAYNNATLEDLAVAAAQKAFELRNRTSEYEKLKITADYYTVATGEIEKAIEALQSLTLMYPRDDEELSTLASAHIDIGQYEKAVAESREAIRLNPNVPRHYFILALALRCLNRFDEEKQICELALTKFDWFSFHVELYRIAFAQGDAASMEKELDVLKRTGPDGLIGLQAGVAWYLGQVRKGRELWNHRADIALSNDRKELAADVISSNAWRAAAFENCQQARDDITRASALPRNAHSFLRFGLVHALCGDVTQAQLIADETLKRYPTHTLISVVQLPILRAAIELRRNNPNQVIQILQTAARYDLAGAGYSVAYWPSYLRGQAYLALHRGTDAAVEFQKILDRRGLAPHEVLSPLAYLGLARAAALQGYTAKARKAYDDFFELWKDADPNIPILIEARREYEKLK